MIITKPAAPTLAQSEHNFWLRSKQNSPLKPQVNNGCPVCQSLRLVIDPELADDAYPAGKPRPCPACYNPATDAALQERLAKEDGLTAVERQYTIQQLAVHRGNRAAIEKATQIAQQHNGIVYLWSYPIHGVGKTHLMAAVCNSFRQSGLQVRYTTMFDLLDWLRGGYDDAQKSNYEQRKEHLLAVPLLCVDEMEKFRGTEFALDAASAIISTRYRAHTELATMLAGNICPDKLPPHIMDRLTPVAIEIVDTKSRRAK